MAEYEIDYKQCFENLIQVTKNRADEERTYFKLLSQLEEISKYTTIAEKHLFDISIADQIPVLSAIIQLGQYHKYICEKYGWEDEVEELNCKEDHCG